MKKTARILLCLVLVISLSATLIACGDDSSSGSLAGRYKISSMTMGGTTVNGDLLDAALDTMGLERDDMYIELKADGTGVMSVMGQSTEMKYADGKIWPVEHESEKVDFTVSGNSLTLEISGYTMTFTK